MVTFNLTKIIKKNIFTFSYDFFFSLFISMEYTYFNILNICFNNNCIKETYYFFIRILFVS